MTWIGFVWRNLLRRRVRTALTAAGVSVGVGLIVALLSVTAGAKRTAADLIHVGRADFGLFQRGASDLTLSRLPGALAAKVDREPGVAAAARIFLSVTDRFLLFGLDPSEFPARRLVITAGSRPHGKEALVGDRAASRLRLTPGGELRVGRRGFRIAGVYHSGNRFEDDGAVLPLDLVQRLAGRPGDVTTIAVAARFDRRSRAVAHELERAFPGTVAIVEPGQAVKVDTSSRLIVSTGWIISLLALIVGGVGVTNTMAMSVIERVREIGILRAVGWPARRIALLILSEALGICLLALGIGLGLGVLGAELFTTGSTSQLIAPDFTAGVFAWGLAFALGVGVLGAIYPTWRAARLTPIEAIRRE